MDDDELTCDLIAAANLAGAYHGMAREYPNSRGGFEKLAAKHGQAVTKLATRLARRGPSGPLEPAGHG